MSGGADQPTGPSLKARALRYLSRREHSRVELGRKLAPHAPDAGTLDALLDDLQTHGWLSDARFADSVVRTRASRYGWRRLQADLSHKGVDADTAAEALHPLRDTEEARARDWWQRKFGEPPATLQERARQFRHLLSRGFGAEVVQRVVPAVTPSPPTED